MKTLEELTNELGLTPSEHELEFGQSGGYVIVDETNKTYTTMSDERLVKILCRKFGFKLYEVSK